MNEQTINFSYWWEQYKEASSEERRRRQIALAIYVVLLLIGSFLAASEIPAIATMDDVGKPIGALLVGPLGLLWVGLEWTGFIVETVGPPGPGWMLLALIHAGLWGIIIYLGIQPVNRTNLQKRAIAKHQESQGQLTGEEAAEKLPLKVGIPVATVQNKAKKPVKVGVDFFTGQGHAIVIAPTRAGKGLQLTDVLLHWPGAAVVVDPKSEQYERMAGFRQRYIGPVYHVPGHRIDLARYYNFRDRDDLKELHDQILRPGEDFQRIFADKSLALFLAVGHYARAKGLNPLRVLLDAAEDEFYRVLVGLDSVPEARPYVRQFTNGQPPDKVTAADRFLSSAYGTFTTRLFGYQKHLDTICPDSSKDTLPREWVMEKSTLYITYSLNELEGVGGVVSAILAGLMRDHMANGHKGRLLVAIDEMAAVRMRHLDTYLATVGGFGITMLLYAQSMSQLTGIYGQASTDAILSNCAHQLWYSPKELQTARLISELYGTALKPKRTYSTGDRPIRQQNGQMQMAPQQIVNESLTEEPAYSPTEVMAVGEETVFVFTEQGQQYRFTGQRLDSRQAFSKLPPPPAVPKVPIVPRRYTTWLPEPEAPAPDKELDGLPPGDTEATEATQQKDDNPATAASPVNTPADPTQEVKLADETAGNESQTPTDPENIVTRYKPDDEALI